VGEAFAKVRDYPVLSHETTITAKSIEVEEDSIVPLRSRKLRESPVQSLFGKSIPMVNIKTLLIEWPKVDKSQHLFKQAS